MQKNTWQEYSCEVQQIKKMIAIICWSAYPKQYTQTCAKQIDPCIIFILCRLQNLVLIYWMPCIVTATQPQESVWPLHRVFVST